MRRNGRWSVRITSVLAGAATVLLPGLPGRAEIDESRYMAPDQLKPGMRGFGRTVLSGTKIETFDLEVIGVMHNAWYAKKDVILVRCSGLNLEHSGIIGGMSGSPCYVVDESGRERMIGAVAYGWTFNKDPICGVQPITQMLEVAKVRQPGKKTDSAGAAADRGPEGPATGGHGLPLPELIARTWRQPISEASRFSIFNDRIAAAAAQDRPTPPSADPLRPLVTPVMVSAVSEQTMSLLREHLEPLGLVPVASGAAGAEALADADKIALEPGSVFCIPLMTGDIEMEALGTCTEVIGDRILAFGHNLFGDGSVELPFATGMVHTVIPSVMRSNKLGAALKTVGTLWGDETSAVFGVKGDGPRMIPLEVTVRDIRGERRYHYEVAQEEVLTPMLIATGASESVLAHSVPPQEHTIRYSIETEFEGLGAFRTTNFTSQDRTSGLTTDTMLPIRVMMQTPFGKVKLVRGRIEVTIEEGARSGQIDQARVDKTVYKPGETVTVRVRWFHYRRAPAFTETSYSLSIPKDVPDGEYPLTLASPGVHLRELHSEKPHWFYVESLPQTLAALNRVGSFPGNRVYLRLGVPQGGVAVKQVEMPELPSYQRRIYSGPGRSDVMPYRQALVEEYETEFAASGSAAFKIRVSRRADQ